MHPGSPDQYARDLASALARLVRAPAWRLALGEGARRRVSAVGLWEAKVQQAGSIYDELMADRARLVNQE